MRKSYVGQNSLFSLSSSDESGFGTKALEDPGIQNSQIYAGLSGSPGRRSRLCQVSTLPEDDTVLFVLSYLRKALPKGEKGAFGTNSCEQSFAQKLNAISLSLSGAGGGEKAQAKNSVTAPHPSPTHLVPC